MKVYFIKKHGALHPLYESDDDNFKRVKEGTIYVKDFKKVRNPDFHALVFAFLNVVYNFQDRFEDFELFRKRVKLLSGCYDEIPIEDGDGNIKIILDPWSWNFGNMDEYEFQKVFSMIKNASLKHFCNHADPGEVDRRVFEIMEFDK